MRVTWTGLTFTGLDVGTVVFAPDHDVKEIQTRGTFGVGGTVIIQGSLSDAEYALLNDVQGNALTITTKLIERIQETTGYVRPQVTAGDGTTSITVIMLLKPKRNS